MGQHAWLLLATILTELLIIVKWSRGQFPNPTPFHVRVGWTIGSGFLVGYPLFKVRHLCCRESLILVSDPVTPSSEFPRLGGTFGGSAVNRREGPPPSERLSDAGVFRSALDRPDWI